MTPDSPVHGPTRRRRGTVTALAVFLLALTAGCGSSEMSDSGGAPAGPASAGEAAAAPDAAGGAGLGDARNLRSGARDKALPQAAPGEGGTAATGASPAAGSGGTAARARIIRTAEVTIEVKDLRTSAARVRAMAESLDGYVSSETTGYRARASQEPSEEDEDTEVRERASAGEAVLVLRIPEAKLATAVDYASGVGEVLTRTSASEDVTTRIADLDSRIKTQRASVKRVRELLDEAGSLKDVVLLEEELTRREADLDALVAGLASVSDRADLSTLTVVLRTPQAREEDDDDDEPGFVEGLESGWKAVLVSTQAVLTVLGALLPIVVVLTLLGLPFALYLRRRHQRRPRPTTAHLAGHAPAAPGQPQVTVPQMPYGTPQQPVAPAQQTPPAPPAAGAPGHGPTPPQPPA